MKVSDVRRWVGPAAIAGGVYLVLSDLSGLPISIPYLSTTSPSGFDAAGSGLILIALTLLLVGMAGLYAKGPAPNTAKVIEYGEPLRKTFPNSSRPSPKKPGTRRPKNRPKRWPRGRRPGLARWSWVPGSFCSFC